MFGFLLIIDNSNFITVALLVFSRVFRSFQGWAISGWDTAYQASQFEGFVRSVPQGQFVVIDMSEDGKGFWQKWDDSSFFGAPFIWTSLHDFGGNDGMKVRVY